MIKVLGLNLNKGVKNDMSYSDEYDVKIYLSSLYSVEELQEQLINFLGATNTEYGSIIYSKEKRISIETNDDYSSIKQKDFPDGFLHFPFFVEVYSLIDSKHEQKINFIRKLLSFFWSQNLPAVASCDFEDELPEKGGYKSRNIPWPL